LTEATQSVRRVLVIEDDPDMRQLLRLLFGRAQFAVVESGNGVDGLRAFYASRPDLVLLDVSLPRMDGWTTLERIREVSDVPVVMLSAHALELERVRGLRAGADDYVTKPFGRQELIARVEAILRRVSSPRTELEVYDDGRLTIAFPQRAVRVGDTEMRLTPTEFRLLAAFVRHPNQILSQTQLVDLVWAERGALAAEVKLYVSYLRRKLRTAGADGMIQTVRGFGYRYVAANGSWHGGRDNRAAAVTPLSRAAG
jgi:DNA-binding response OmpR family regulator